MAQLLNPGTNKTAPDTKKAGKGQVGSETLTPIVRVLPEAAKRALAEAEDRRVERERALADLAPEKDPELGGRDGPEPTRYGDWEKKGIAVDF